MIFSPLFGPHQIIATGELNGNQLQDFSGVFSFFYYHCYYSLVAVDLFSIKNLDDSICLVMEDHNACQFIGNVVYVY